MSIFHLISIQLFFSLTTPLLILSPPLNLLLHQISTIFLRPSTLLYYSPSTSILRLTFIQCLFSSTILFLKNFSLPIFLFHFISLPRSLHFNYSALPTLLHFICPLHFLLSISLLSTQSYPLPFSFPPPLLCNLSPYYLLFSST